MENKLNGKIYKLKTKGNGKNGKVYEYEVRTIFLKSCLCDLIQLIGYEATLRLVHFYGQSQIYVPGKKSLQRMITESAVADEAERLMKKEKLSRQKTIDKLMQEGYWNRPRKALENKMSEWFGKEKDVIREAQRQILLEESSKPQHRILLRDYGVLV